MQTTYFLVRAVRLGKVSDQNNNSRKTVPRVSVLINSKQVSKITAKVTLGEQERENEGGRGNNLSYNSRTGQSLEPNENSAMKRKANEMMACAKFCG